MAPDFHLASRSPRRQALLTALGYRYAVQAADIDETPVPGEAPAAFARRMAVGKARAAAAALPPGSRVLAADTDVALAGEILGKPADEAQAVAMLRRLSGAVHEVHSAVALLAGGQLTVAQTLTRVEFATVSEAAARAYWASGEPRDKAGGYAIQGRGGRWVRRIEGSPSGVVGLPLAETVALLAAVGIEPEGGA